MSSPETVRCPKCQNLTWNYIPKTDNRNYELYTCNRCGFSFKLGKCKVCNTKNWHSLRTDFEKGAKRPIERYECRSCKRVISLRQS